MSFKRYIGLRMYGLLCKCEYKIKRILNIKRRTNIKQLKKCDGSIINVTKAEISGDAYGWDFWYYTDENKCLHCFEVEEDLEDLIIIDKYIEKWTKKIRKKNDNRRFSFVVHL